jgi:hypothetical protein
VVVAGWHTYIYTQVAMGDRALMRFGVTYNRRERCPDAMAALTLTNETAVSSNWSVYSDMPHSGAYTCIAYSTRVYVCTQLQHASTLHMYVICSMRTRARIRQPYTSSLALHLCLSTSVPAQGALVYAMQIHLFVRQMAVHFPRRQRRRRCAAGRTHNA